MPQVRTITTSVAGPKFKEQGAAVEEFWRRMEAANGGRPEDPHDYISLVDVHWEDGRGWVIEYEVPAELLEQRAVSVIREEPEINSQNVLEPANLADAGPIQALKPRPKCHVLSCMSPCIEGSSYCANHQTAEARAEARGAPATTEPFEPVFESFDKEQPVPVKDIMITGWNPRKAFDPEALQALAEDIRQNELINAITVRPKGKRYELVAGERRLRAFRLLGRATIPAKVRELTDEQMLDVMLAENLQRVDLNPIEEAHHLKRVLEVGKLTQTDLGKRVGKSQEWVSQRLRLAEAPGVLQDLIICRQINTSSAIEILQWKNTEHYDAIMHEIGAWSVEGEELPRARVREIIKEITEPTEETVEPIESPTSGDPTCKDCGNSRWVRDTNSIGVRRVCEFHGNVNPDSRYCERFVALSGPDPFGVVHNGAAEHADQPFVNPEDCKDCDIYDRENDTCQEGCTCDSECEDSFCEVTDDEEGGCEMFGVPGAADDEVCAVDCPDYEECKNEAAEKEEDDQDLPDEPEPTTVAEVGPHEIGKASRDPWAKEVRTFDCKVCHQVFIDKKGMETVAMVTHLIGDGYHDAHEDAARKVLAKAHERPIKEDLLRYFGGGSELEDDVRIREHEADLAVKEFDDGSRWQGSAYLEECCRSGDKEAIEARKKRNKLTEARLKIRKEAEAKGVTL